MVDHTDTVNRGGKEFKMNAVDVIRVWRHTNIDPSVVDSGDLAKKVIGYAPHVVDPSYNSKTIPTTQPVSKAMERRATKICSVGRDRTQCLQFRYSSDCSQWDESG
jgi:hypothetical protein